MGDLVNVLFKGNGLWSAGWSFSSLFVLPSDPSLAGVSALCLVRGGLVVACFHYIAGVGGWFGVR